MLGASSRIGAGRPARELERQRQIHAKSGKTQGMLAMEAGLPDRTESRFSRTKVSNMWKLP